MKILVYAVREDEKDAFKLYQEKHPEIELEIHESLLTEESSQYIREGFDAICVSQVRAISEEIYRKVANCGIKIWATRSAGFDMYRLDLLKELGIRLVRVPVYSPNAIAEYAVSGALYFSRNFDKIQKNVQELDLRWIKPIVSEEIRKQKVGIFGTGNIGRVAALHFKNLGAEVYGYDLYPSKEAAEILTYVESLEELVKTCDIISLHAPATEENYHIFNEELFNLCKPNLIFVNTARGSLVDTKAMLKALDDKKIRAVVMDTYEFEGPYINKVWKKEDIKDEVLLALIEREDVLYSPHIAFYTHTAIENLVHIALDAAVKVFNTGKANEEVIL